ncbi:MAG: MutS-related protein [Candidatus Scatomorpha sp.]|jgi:hypothetical protein
MGLFGSISYKKNLRRSLRENYGRTPDPFYSAGDLDLIRSYHDYMREHDPDTFRVDDITWSDLDMDRVFKRINPGVSTPGEHWLYYMLRTPAMDAEEYARRERLIHFAEENERERQETQFLLGCLGRFRRADVCRIFAPESEGYFTMVIYILLALSLLCSPLSLIWLGAKGLLITLALFALNVMLHEWNLRHCQAEIDTVNFSVSMAFTLRKMRSLGYAELDECLSGAYERLARLRPLMALGSIPARSSDMSGDIATSALLLDLIMFEYLKNKLGGLHEDILAVFEALGRVDAAIAVASWRESMPLWCEPELDFETGERYVEAESLVHPLLRSPVPNDLRLDRPALVTGSNASGKSTYLRTALLAALLSQTACTCPGASYRGAAFHIYSAMALRDDILSGESYYIAEILATKRILDAAEAGEPVFCAVDEVLRGTNTIERISAASEILLALRRSGSLCIAATHDLELCTILAGEYGMLHFEETVTDEGMSFDYRVRPGKTETRNAIQLLRLMGLDDEITDRADERAAAFIRTGAWTRF